MRGTADGSPGPLWPGRCTSPNLLHDCEAGLTGSGSGSGARDSSGVLAPMTMAEQPAWAAQLTQHHENSCFMLPPAEPSSVCSSGAAAPGICTHTPSLSRCTALPASRRNALERQVREIALYYARLISVVHEEVGVGGGRVGRREEGGQRGKWQHMLV